MGGYGEVIQAGRMSKHPGDSPEGSRIPGGYADNDGNTRGVDAERPTRSPFAETLPVGEVEESPPPERRFGKYRVESLLGSGGMGEVYKAYDTVLQRYVALKFIRSADPGSARRFMQEARAQARVDHEHVCKIYEVGEIEHRLYIAMQFIDGIPVGAAAERMTLEQKIKVIQEAAEGLHAAHQLGIIHRDVKPTNILVEQTEAGQWKPYILDFGLAREVGASGETRMGMAVGTPAYMSPEQARGRLDRLDRRTDVYSLGATLYELLTGRPAYSGESSMDVLMAVIHTDPAPLRKWNRAIPADLETIVMKCLEKEPQQRYDSARALAEDLGRWLAGEPILAKKTARFYRWKKWVRKHRFEALTLGTAAGLFLVLMGMFLHTRIQAARRLRVASELGQAVKEMEYLVERSSLLPLHDITYVHALIRKRMAWIRRQMKALGPIADGPGYYALGRGYLDLKQFESARAALIQAWDRHGYRTPEVAYALGLTYAELYRRRLEETERIRDRGLREQRLRAIKKQYRKPAVRYLTKGRPVAASGYVEVLLRYLSGNYPGTVQRAEKLTQRVPWLYEADLVAGDAFHRLANQRRSTGKYPEAAAFYRKAVQAYRKAARIGRSDPRTYVGLCKVRKDWMKMLRYYFSDSPEPIYREALNACNRALQADPANLPALNAKINAVWRWGEYLLYSGKDPRPSLRQAEVTARRALALDPSRAEVHRNLAITYRLQGVYEMTTGIDPEESFARAIQHFTAVIGANPNATMAYNNVGNVHADLAYWRQYHGRDPRESYRRAVEAYRSALRMHPDLAQLHTNLGTAFMDQAIYEIEHGLDPTASLKDAEKAIRRALDIHPGDIFSLVYQGRIEQLRAWYASATGGDPEPASRRAVEILTQAIQVNPQWTDAYHYLGETFWVRARHDWHEDRDPSGNLDQARRFLNQSLEPNPNLFESYYLLGRVELLQARWEMKRHRNPTRSLDQAERHMKNALQANPQDPTSWAGLAAVHRRRAEYLISQKKSPDAVLDRGVEAVERALKINPTAAEAYEIRGGLLWLKARGTGDETARAAWRERAREDFRKAHALNPRIPLEDPDISVPGDGT